MTPTPPYSARILEGLARWTHTGERRPSFAVIPGPDQESVWDYPRPPRVEPVAETVRVRVGETTVAETDAALRVLETAGPPTVYLPPQDVDRSLLRPARGGSVCEWKGTARYWSIDADGELLEAVAWSYERPHREYAELAGFISFYPARTACFIGDERVEPQPGGFYGGWVTSRITGPIKGEPGTGGW